MTPSRVVGTGTAASCTFAALQSSVALGTGLITFNCGSNVVTITMTSVVNIVADTTIDGNNLVVLNAQGTHRHFTINGNPTSNPNFNNPNPRVTFRNLAFVNGFGTGTDPAVGATDGGGGSIYRYGGLLNGKFFFPVWVFFRIVPVYRLYIRYLTLKVFFFFSFLFSTSSSFVLLKHSPQLRIVCSTTRRAKLLAKIKPEAQATLSVVSVPHSSAPL